MKQLRELIGKNVEIVANGIVYKGILKDVSEQAVSILSTSGWLEVTMSSISKISEAVPQVFETKYIDPSFYQDK
jgi:ferredoxin-fold anticodon binding domain-containing protein